MALIDFSEGRDGSEELGIQDIMPMGKYRGSLIEDLLEDDPTYLVWCIENDACSFDEEVMHLLALGGHY